MVIFANLLIDILVLIIGVSTLIFIYLKHLYSYFDRKGFKTAPGLNYLTGHLGFDLGRTAFVHKITSLYDSTSDSFIGGFLLVKPKLLVRDPELIRSILIKDFSHFTDRDLPYNEREPLTAHLFALDGQKWRNLRNKLSPTFTSGEVKSHVSDINRAWFNFTTISG